MADYNEYKSSLEAAEIESRLIGAVVHNKPMNLTDAQKARARENIGAGSADNSFVVLGYFATVQELEAAVSEPKAGPFYGVGETEPYDYYSWDELHSVWVNNGPMKGTAGAPGSDANVTKENIATALGYTPAPGVLTFQITLFADNWSDGQQTVVDANFLADGYAYIISPASEFFTEYAEAAIHAEDVKTDNKMVFKAQDAPTINIFVNVVRMVSV